VVPTPVVTRQNAHALRLRIVGALKNDPSKAASLLTQRAVAGVPWLLWDFIFFLSAGHVLVGLGALALPGHGLCLLGAVVRRLALPRPVKLIASARLGVCCERSGVWASRDVKSKSGEKCGSMYVGKPCHHGGGGHGGSPEAKKSCPHGSWEVPIVHVCVEFEWPSGPSPAPSYGPNTFPYPPFVPEG
jgi:hypothetical protein